MKRITALLLVLFLMLTGCGRKKEPGVTYPEPAEAPPCVLTPVRLTEEEFRQANPSRQFTNSAAFTFRLAQEADGIKLMIFKLENGAWEDLSGGSWDTLYGDQWDSHGTREGTVLVQFDRLWDTCQVTRPSSQSTMLPLDDPDGKLDSLNSQTAFLTSPVEVPWEQLIPVALQVVSHQDRVYAPGLDIWKHPEAYEGQGYEAVYLLAVAFRQSTYVSPVETFQ